MVDLERVITKKCGQDNSSGIKYNPEQYIYYMEQKAELPGDTRNPYTHPARTIPGPYEAP
jgi:hypothetical protein